MQGVIVEKRKNGKREGNSVRAPQILIHNYYHPRYCLREEETRPKTIIVLETASGMVVKMNQNPTGKLAKLRVDVQGRIVTIPLTLSTPTLHLLVPHVPHLAVDNLHNLHNLHNEHPHP
jgi:hypothetical protein